MAYIGRQPSYGAFEKETLTPDGSTTTFTLSYQVGSSAAVLVSVAGVLQEPEVAYNLSGGGISITFTEAPLSGDVVYVIYLGIAYDIGEALSSGSITAKTSLSTGVQGADTLLIYDNSAGNLKKLTLDDLITGQTELATQAADDDFLIVYDTSATEIKKIQKSNLAASLSYSKGTFTGDGSTTTITISGSRSVDDVLVFVNGICLVPTDDYTISSTTLTFQLAPVDGAEITVRYLPI